MEFANLRDGAPDIKKRTQAMEEEGMVHPQATGSSWHVLDLYHEEYDREEYDRERPVVCFDETSKQLL